MRVVKIDGMVVIYIYIIRLKMIYQKKSFELKSRRHRFGALLFQFISGLLFLDTP